MELEFSFLEGVKAAVDTPLVKNPPFMEKRMQ